MDTAPFLGKKITFIRHAESMANAGFATADHSSVPLSPKGFAQAEQLAQNFPFCPELVVVSTFLRTHQTAAPFQERFKDVPTETWDMVHEFTYLDRNKHRNTTSAERKNSVLSYWSKRDPFHRDGPQEESFLDLLLRGERMFDALAEREERSIVVFSHGEFLSSLRIVQKLDREVRALTQDDLEELMDIFLDLKVSDPIRNAVPMAWKELLS